MFAEFSHVLAYFIEYNNIIVYHEKVGDNRRRISPGIFISNSVGICIFIW